MQDWDIATADNYYYHFTAIIQDNLRWRTPPVKNWRILLEQSFTVCMPLPTASSAFGRDVVSVSTSRSRDVVSKRLGLVEMWEGLDLVSDWKLNVSVSYHRILFTSQYAQLFASLQNCTYTWFWTQDVCCLLIKKSKRLTVCTTQNVVSRVSCNMLPSCPSFT